MHPYALSIVADPAAAIAAHARDPRLAFIAGGTDLIGLMKDRAQLPERLLDINGLPDMARIEALPDGGLRIGALARMSDVAAHPDVRRRFPVIAEGLLFAASGQLRNMASMGGNIMQRTRCAYFRDEDDLPCNKRRPGSGCAALHGLNRNHAIFGWSDACIATNPSDVAVALAAMDAIVIVRGRTGERLIPFADFHRVPGTAPERDNALSRGDLITAIEVPASVEASASHYLKVRDRESYEFALVSAAAAIATDGRRIRSARLAMGGVAHKPWRLTAAETALRGLSLDDNDTLRAAIARSFDDARPLAHNAFKVELAQRATLIAIDYEIGRPIVFSPPMARDAVDPPQRMWPLASSIGDTETAIANAAVRIDGAYTMPDRHHNPMEPHATLAVWGEDGTLTLYDSTQMVFGTKKLAALVLGLPEHKINVVCEFLGGGFGGKSWSWPHTLLAALAAQA